MQSDWWKTVVVNRGGQELRLDREEHKSGFHLIKQLINNKLQNVHLFDCLLYQFFYSFKLFILSNRSYISCWSKYGFYTQEKATKQNGSSHSFVSVKMLDEKDAQKWTKEIQNNFPTHEYEIVTAGEKNQVKVQIIEKKNIKKNRKSADSGEKRIL